MCALVRNVVFPTGYKPFLLFLSTILSLSVSFFLSILFFRAWVIFLIDTRYPVRAGPMAVRHFADSCTNSATQAMLKFECKARRTNGISITLTVKFQFESVAALENQWKGMEKGERSWLDRYIVRSLFCTYLQYLILINVHEVTQVILDILGSILMEGEERNVTNLHKLVGIIRTR